MINLKPKIKGYIMIYDVVTKSMFRDAFRGSNNYKDNFTYEGLGALYDYLDQLSEESGQDIELDPCAIACEYAEYASLEDFQADYGEDYQSIEDIERETTVIQFEGGFLVVQF